MANVEYLQEVVQFIKDYPEKHNQVVWACETGACFAGWAALLTGDFKIVPDYDGSLINLKTGAHTTAWTEGRKALGLTVDESEIFFDALNTADMLELMVKDVADGKDITALWYEEDDGIYRRVGDENE